MDRCLSTKFGISTYIHIPHVMAFPFPIIINNMCTIVLLVEVGPEMVAFQTSLKGN